MPRLRKLIQICIPSLFLLCLAAGDDDKYESFSWYNSDVKKWDDFNTLFSIQSSEMIPHPKKEGSLLKSRGYTKRYFNFGPKFPIREPDTRFIPEPASPKYNDREFNISAERFGGFGGSGDTKGYGAYEFSTDDDSRFGSSFGNIMKLPKAKKQSFIDTFLSLFPMQDV